MGMVKPKEYDWKDSNLALFGSDLEKNVKKAAAETEKAWTGAGSKLGLEIWRIENFKVVPWKKDDYGKFYDGDSYIIMNTYIKPDEEDFEFDLHFWIGRDSTQDEYGTAAYKTVELDTLLNDKPVQHREVMGYESDLFLSYFKSLTVLHGGVASGFKHVEKKDIKPRLFHFHGDKKGVTVREVPKNKKNLDSSDVFILETEKVIFQWNGATCNKDEKFKATQFCQTLKSERFGKPSVEVVEDDPSDADSDFFTFMSDEAEVEERSKFEDPDIHKLFRLSDASGSMEFTEVASGEINMGMFDDNDVFIFDKKGHCYVWIGKGASPDEKKGWPMYAHQYLAKTPNPAKPVTAVNQGKEPKNFLL